MIRFSAILFTLAATWPSPAADQAFDPESLAKRIAPHLDDQTLMVAHVDLSRVDLDAAFTKLAQVGGLVVGERRGRSFGTDGKVTTKTTDIRLFEVMELDQLKQTARPWLDRMTKAGAKEVFVVVSLADFPGPPFVIVPLEPGGNAAALSGLLAGGQPDPKQPRPFTMEVAAQVGQAVFAGSKTTLDRVRKLQPTPRPEMVRAFAAAGDAAAQLLILPTADNRRVIEELLPTLPRVVGGQPSTLLTHGMIWAALGLGAGPTNSVRLVIQSQDTTAAKALHGFLGNVFNTLAQGKLGLQVGPSFAKLVPKLLPNVEEDRLTLALDDSTLIEVLKPIAGQAARSANQAATKNHLKQIAIAFQAYLDATVALPAAAIMDKNGKPLLSWRVQILPYVGADALYKEFHLDEPWDSKHNRKLIERMPEVFRSSKELGLAGKTTYLAPVGAATMFPGGPKGLTIRDVLDGTANTILIVAANDDHAVIWSKPEDLPYDPAQPLQGLGEGPEGGFFVLAVDGSVHFLPKTIDVKILRALFTRNGGEAVGFP